MRLLVVDGDLVSRARLWRALKPSFDVEVAGDLAQALAQLEKSEFAAVLCSHDPDAGQSGLDIARECRTVDPAISCLLLTDDPAHVLSDPALAKLIDATVGRIGRPRDLIAAVRACLDQRDGATPVRDLAQPAAPPAGADQRRAPRVAVEWPIDLGVRFTSWAGFGSAYTRNVSRGGLLVHLSEALPLGQDIRVTLQLPNGMKPVFAARVRRVNEVEVTTTQVDSAELRHRSYEVGLELVDLTLEQEEILASALNEVSSDAGG